MVSLLQKRKKAYLSNKRSKLGRVQEKETIAKGRYRKYRGKEASVIPRMRIKPIISQPQHHFVVLCYHPKNTLTISVPSPCSRLKYRLT